MKWITREKVKVDRVACPWLIKKFIDADAEFLVGKDGSIGIYLYGKAIPLDPGMYADIEARYGLSLPGQANQTGQTGPAALPWYEADPTGIIGGQKAAVQMQQQEEEKRRQMSHGV